MSIAKIGTKSVRATVPEGIVAFLDLKVGDKLVWKMDMKDNARIAMVSKKPFTEKDLGAKSTLNYIPPKRVKKR